MAYNKLIDLNLLSNFLSKIKSLIPTKTSDLENDSEYITGMEILSYGNSTWNDFLTAYTAKKVVYCRASSNSNPASGSQTRLAFMAYVNNADNPTNVEFQYYRSVSSHTSTQQGDQVFVYKLDKTSGWSVTTREASSKIVAGTNMTSSYSSDTLTLNANIPSNVSDLTNDSGYITGITSSDVTTALGYTPSSTDTTYSAGNGIDITNTIIKNTQGIEYIVGTQTAATAVWTGNSTDEALYIGKIIAYYLPYAGTSTAATLTLTMKNGATTEAIRLLRVGSNTITTQFAANNVIILIYDGTYWRVSAYYDSDTNTVPTGYCATGASTAAKSATCTYGYRDDTNYFPCLFRYANTAANATLAIASYETTALPIYVNGERTSATNTFGRGVILFLYYDGAYYCYNDGRLPILVDGVVTSVQDYTNELKNTISEISQVITSTDIDSTPIATFDASAADMPLKRLTVNIEPVQEGSGDPSPDNVRPITGWTGCKIFYPALDITRDLAIVKNKYISTSGVETDSGADFSHTDYFPVTPGATLYFSSYWDELPDSAPSIVFYDANKTFKTRRFCLPNVNQNKGHIGYNFMAHTVPSGYYFAILNFSYRIRNRIVLTDKDPTIVFPTEAGTVYGGTVDAVNKKLTVDRVIRQITVVDQASDGSVKYAVVKVEPRGTLKLGAIGLSNILKYNPANAPGSLQDGEFAIVNSSAYNSDVIDFYLAGASYVSLEERKNWYDEQLAAYQAAGHPLEVVYPLATPIVYDLSDVPEITTLLCENNIWADAGDVTVTYGAYLETIKSYTDQLNNNIPNTSSISNTGLISIKHDSTELFTIQLPLYNGGVSNGT